MLSPLVVAAIENSGTCRVRFALRAYLVEDTSRRIIASREFEAVAIAPSADPYGGVVAANQAVRTVLENLATFCAEAAGNWRPLNRTSGKP